jgi:tetratricopeptide (TPR) repeat protein
LLALVLLTGCGQVLTPPGEKAVNELASGHYEQAIELYTQAIELDSTGATFFNGRGTAYLFLQRYPEAISDLSKAIELRANDQTAFFNRSLCYQNLHQYKLALADLDQALRLTPNDVSVLVSRAIVYLAAKSPKSALRDATKAITLDPKSADAYLQRGMAYEDLKQYAKAIDDLTKSARLAPNGTQAYRQRAWCYSLLGNHQLVIRDCSLAISHGDSDPAILDLRAVSYSALKKFPEAYNDYNTALKIDPNDDLARVNLASLLKKHKPPAAQVAAAATQGAVPTNSAIGDKWALVIGIGKFQDRNVAALPVSTKDAKDFYRFLVSTGGFQPDHVRLLLDNTAKERRIKSEFNKFLAHVTRPEDLVVIYITTHGSPSSSDVRGDNYIICNDTSCDDLFATSLEMQTLMRMIKDRITSRRIVLVLDCCFSGNTTTGTRAIKGTGQMVICSSSPNQVSFESSRYKNGVFTRRLIEGLSQNRGYVTIPTAFAATRAAVINEVREDYGFSQVPVMHSKWSGGDLILAAPPKSRRSLPQSVQASLEPDDSGK